MTCNLLLSYAFHEKTDLAVVRRNLICGLVMIDSGAFTAFTIGRKIDRVAYAEYLERWRDCWDHAITLDVIGDPKATGVNTRWLHNRGLPVMPVFTPGGSLAEFDAMVRDHSYVAVGGLVGTPRKIQVQRCGMLQRRAQANGGGIHALGIGSLATIRAARPYSCDASTITGAFRFGAVVFFDGTTIRSVAIRDHARLTMYREAIRSHGIDLADLVVKGRMPKLQFRGELMQAMSLAYTCADEHIKRIVPVPPPRGRSAGPHLYSAVTTVQDAVPFTRTDTLLHAGPHLYDSVGADNPSYAYMLSDVDRVVHRAVDPSTMAVWIRHGRHHICVPRKVATS